MTTIKELIDDSKPMIKVAKAQIDLIVALIESTRDPRLATATSVTLREIGALYNDAAEKLAAHVPKSET
jgi:hypothetical protein